MKLMLWLAALPDALPGAAVHEDVIRIKPLDFNPPQPLE